jgi:hypothetical protein
MGHAVDLGKNPVYELSAEDHLVVLAEDEF